jgi:hypothetical protein
LNNVIARAKPEAISAIALGIASSGYRPPRNDEEHP